MAKTATTRKKTTAKKSKSRTTPPPPPKKKTGRAAAEPNPGNGGNILGGVIFLVLAVCSVISYFNTEGSFVDFFSTWMRGLLGWGFYLAAPAFAVSAILLFASGDRPVGARIFATVMLPVLLAALSDLMLNTEIREGTAFRDAVNNLFETGIVMKSGGVIGGLIANGMNRTLSMYGTFPLLILGFLYAFIVCCWGSLGRLIARITRSHNAYVAYEEKRVKQEKSLADAGIIRKKADRERQQTVILQGEKRAVVFGDIPLGDDEEALTPGAAKGVVKGNASGESRRRKKNPEIICEMAPDVITDIKPAHLSQNTRSESQDILAPVNPDEMFPVQPIRAETQQKMQSSASRGTGEKTGKEANTSGAQRGRPKTRTEKPAKRTDIKVEAQRIEQAISEAEPEGDYVFPPISLLRASNAAVSDASDEVALNRERLEEAIRSFGISASVVGVIRGPTVTRYDLELDRGVKLARITNLAGDLALSLGVMNVRIAPIPDKISTVGIEVPNRTVSTVFLRDILESSAFASARSKLSFALGKDIGGNCIVGNISKLPHLLIAGTTGSGKSVCMNSLILSLLYKGRPDEVKLIMIDPKMVELGIYNGIPHLYVPVVTDPKKAAGALQWSVVEMMKRYRAFSELGVRDLENYNRIRKQQGETTEPQVVIVIDELADLMLVASKDVEESICRVAQMGRAAGMHLIIATQRPSADVITGLMKANIPSRIAFAVSSSLESRIILDQSGAEKLIGFGDMLYAPIGTGKPTRIQGSFVSDEEREAVITFIKEHNGPGEENNSELETYMINATKDKKDSSEGRSVDSESPSGDYDEMLPQAVEVVLEMGSCSVSMLQRRLKLGYSRAARIVDQMEELGVVGPYEGAKPRGVAIDRNGWHAMQVKLGYLPADALIDYEQEDGLETFDHDPE